MMSYEEFKRRHRKVSKTVIMYYNKQWEEVSKENATFVRIAEFDEEGHSHSWFIGYSNVDDPDLVVAVIVENGGSGSEAAVPIAGQIFDAYYSN